MGQENSPEMRAGTKAVNPSRRVLPPCSATCASDGTVQSRLSFARGAEPLVAQFTDLGARALVAEPTDRLRTRHATIWNVEKKTLELLRD